MFPHDPMAAATAADEPDFFVLSPDAEGETIFPAAPAQDDNSPGRVDRDIARHFARVYQSTGS